MFQAYFIRKLMFVYCHFYFNFGVQEKNAGRILAMNRIYQVIWNRVRNCYVVVSELARRDGKGTLRRRKAAAAVGAGLLAFGAAVSPVLAAEPEAGIIQRNQYVAFKYASGDPSGNTWVINGATYNKVQVDG